MRSRRLIFLYLFILFTSGFAQKYNRIDQDEGEEKDDDENIPQSENQNPPAPNINNRVEAANPPPIKVTNPIVQQVNPNPVLQPANANPVPARSVFNPARRTAPATPLASSSECKLDIQKYCNKGGEQIISNLKVLQCVDDLDNVSLINYLLL